MDSPNVTAIAQNMSMTKGGISKNIKKLVKAGLVCAYQDGNDNKKIFYSLTNEGKKIYERHDIAHKNWIERDNNFIAQFSENKIDIVAEFLEAYIEHLNTEIEKRV